MGRPPLADPDDEVVTAGQDVSAINQAPASSAAASASPGARTRSSGEIPKEQAEARRQRGRPKGSTKRGSRGKSYFNIEFAIPYNIGTQFLLFI